MTRRGRGEGNIVQRADGRWMARITVVADDGARTRKAFYGPTREAVDAQMTLARAGLLQGIPILPAEVTVDDLLGLWLESIRTEVRASTLSGYRVNCWRHISPVVGKIRLVNLRPADVEAVKVSCAAKGLSPRSIQYARVTLRVAVKWAMDHELVGRNVVDLTKSPRVERPEVSPLSVTQIRTFLDGVEADRLRALYMLAFSVGLRQGELLGLRWQDIDFGAGTLRVVRTYQRAGKFGPPKSQKSRRVITLPAVALGALERHQREQETEREVMGDDWDVAGDLVFANPFGLPLDPTTLSKWFKGHLKRLGLPDKRFHDARHSAATMLISQHVSLRVVQEILGHESLNLIDKVYGHLVPALHHEAAGAVDLALKVSGDTNSSRRKGASHLRLLSTPDS